MTRVYNV